MTKSLSLSLRGAGITALALIATYSIVGCGGGNDNSTSALTPNPTPTPVPTASPSPVVSPNPTPSVPVPTPSPDPTPNPVVTTESGLQYQDIIIGTGAEATKGTIATVKYVGTFTDGTQFDAGTFSLIVGGGQVIQGFDEGVAGMKVGGKRLLFIPSKLAYGATGNGSIPPNTPLNFSVELTNVTGAAK